MRLNIATSRSSFISKGWLVLSMLFTTLTIAHFRPLLYGVFNDFGGAEEA
jgi:hypothetical protein